jgi:two-component system sensor histidine kinase PilS (NtrC family)
MDERRRLVWYVAVRVVVVSLFLVSTSLLSGGEPASLGEWVLHDLTPLFVSTYLYSLISLIVLRYARRSLVPLAYGQLVWDLLFVTLLVLLTGGISSPFPFLYLIAIAGASILLSRREALYTASLCSILYGAIIDLQFYGRLAPLGLSQETAWQLGTGYILYSTFLNIVGFYLIAFLTGYLTERALRSERALRQKIIDFDELERLNSSLVANINSGVLTVTCDGHVRVFNRYAEFLTGISQDDAYDRPLAEVIPAFSAYPTGIGVVEGGELRFVDNRGAEKLLGFKTAPFHDSSGAIIGTIISFQDVTRLREMERELKRSDRLAALGELSARMAHEIRNPLASISGSVEMIAQGSGIDSGDQALLRIVMRETERLNRLISDFLLYARPPRVERSPVELGPLLRDQVELLSADQRFAAVSMKIDCPAGLTISADGGQLRQVFWNLLVNGAEAMPLGSGEIAISCQVVHSAGHRVRITVADNGSGMSGEQAAHLFEPFFTTKSGGSGLGLATVYRIVESHGGTIHVDSAPGRGTTFTIMLPVDSL